MELKLKSCVMDWRRPHPTRWSHQCSAKLSMLLPHLEKSPASSSSIKTETDNLLDCMQDYKVMGLKPIKDEKTPARGNCLVVVIEKSLLTIPCVFRCLAFPSGWPIRTWVQ